MLMTSVNCYEHNERVTRRTATVVLLSSLLNHHADNVCCIDDVITGCILLSHILYTDRKKSDYIPIVIVKNLSGDLSGTFRSGVP